MTDYITLIQDHLCKGKTFIRVSYCMKYLGADFQGTKDVLLSYEGVRRTNNPDVLSLKKCYKDVKGFGIGSWDIVVLDENGYPKTLRKH